MWSSHHLPHMRSVSLVKIERQPIETPALTHLPYLKELLSSWELPVGESRISLLETGATVEEHVDVEFYWKHRLRIHIVVQSNLDALFGCDGDVLHLPEGQVWVSNNWAPHWISNRGNTDRIHIVIDTVGSPIVWRWIKEGWHTSHNFPCPSTDSLPLFEPKNHDQSMCLEPSKWGQVRSPVEVQEIVDDILVDATTPYHESQSLLKQFVRDWRWLYHSYENSHRSHYLNLLERLLHHLPEHIMPNGLRAHQILTRQIGASLFPSPIIAEEMTLIDVTPNERHPFIEQLAQDHPFPIYLENYDEEFHVSRDYTIVERLTLSLRSLDAKHWIDLPISELAQPIIVLRPPPTSDIESSPRPPNQNRTSTIQTVLTRETI